MRQCWNDAWPQCSVMGLGARLLPLPHFCQELRLVRDAESLLSKLQMVQS